MILWKVVVKFGINLNVDIEYKEDGYIANKEDGDIEYEEDGDIEYKEGWDIEYTKDRLLDFSRLIGLFTLKLTSTAACSSYQRNNFRILGYL